MKAENLKIGDQILVANGGAICYHKVCKIEEITGLFGEKQLEVTSKPLRIHPTIQIFRLDDEIVRYENLSPSKKTRSATK